MPKLTKKLSAVFAFYASEQSATHFAKTRLELNKIAELKSYFEEAESYSDAFKKFNEFVKEKNLEKDPFAVALLKAYPTEHQTVKEDDIFKEIREVEQEEDPSFSDTFEKFNAVPLQKNLSYGSFSLPLFNTSPTDHQIVEEDDIFKEMREVETNDAVVQATNALNKKRGFETLLQNLLAECSNRKIEDKEGKKAKLLENLNICIQVNTEPTVMLTEMVRMLCERITIDKLAKNSPENKLIITLLTAFMLFDKPTALEYQKLITFLVAISNANKRNLRFLNLDLPIEENLILDLFYLRLNTLNNVEEITQCQEFLQKISEENKFQFKEFPLDAKHLLTDQQFFETLTDEKTAFTAYQKFIENLANAMAFYRTVPLEENKNMVSRLLEVGIARLLQCKHKQIPTTVLLDTTNKTFIIDKAPVILPEVEKFLNFLAEIYKKSSLISKNVFKKSIERLLMQQAKLLPEPKNISDLVQLNKQLYAIHTRYNALNSDKTDQKNFLTLLAANTQYRYKNVLKTEENYYTLMTPLFNGIDTNNSDFVRHIVTELLALNCDYVLNSLDALKCKLNSVQSEFMDELGKKITSKYTPFLTVLSGLYNNPYAWTNLKWRQITKIVAPFEEKGDFKQALIGALNYGAMNYGLTSFSNKAKIPKEWEEFRTSTYYLFLMLHDPSNEEDNTFISNFPKGLKEKTGSSFADTFVPVCAYRIFIQLPTVIALINQYQIPCKQGEVEKFLRGIVNNFEPAFNYLAEDSAVLYKNETFFAAWLNVLATVGLRTDVLQKLPTNEINKAIVAHLTQISFVKRRIEIGSQVSWGYPLATIQEEIVDTYNALNQQGLDISEAFLELYFSSCKTDEDYQIFIKFLFTDLPARSNVSPDNSALDYLAKALEKLSSLAQYAAPIEDLADNEKFNGILLVCSRVAAQKFPNAIESLALLSGIQTHLNNASSNENNTEDFEEIKTHYAKIAEGYLSDLQTALEKLTIPNDLIEKSKIIGEPQSNLIKTFADDVLKKKQDMLSHIQTNKDELLNIDSYEILEEWHNELNENSKAIEKLDQDFTVLSDELKSNIEKRKIHFIYWQLKNHERETSQIKEVFENYENLQAEKKATYTPLQHFKQTSNNKTEFADDLENYFNSVDETFQKLNTFMGAATKKLLTIFTRISKKTDTQIKSNLENQLREKSLREQMQTLEQLSEDDRQSIFLVAKLTTDARMILSDASVILSRENEKIMQKFAAPITQINEKISLTQQEVAKHQQEKTTLETKVTEIKAQINLLIPGIQACEETIEDDENSFDVSTSLAVLNLNLSNKLKQALNIKHNSQYSEFKQIVQQAGNIFNTTLHNYQQERKKLKASTWFALAQWINKHTRWFIPTGFESWAKKYVGKVEVILPSKINALEMAICFTDRLFNVCSALTDNDAVVLFGDATNLSTLRTLANDPMQSEPEKSTVSNLITLVEGISATLAQNAEYKKAEETNRLEYEALDKTISDQKQTLKQLNDQLQPLNEALLAAENSLRTNATSLESSETNQATLEEEKNLLFNTYEALSKNEAKTSRSPLTYIFYDETLARDPNYEALKIKQLEDRIAENKIEYYESDSFNPSSTLLANPIYHAVEVGTAGMLDVILKGMHVLPTVRLPDLLGLGDTPIDKKQICLNKKVNNHSFEKIELLTPLHRAIQKNDLEKVKLLVEAGSDLNSCAIIHAKDIELEMPALLFAYHLGKNQIVDYLMTKNANVNGIDKITGNTLLHMAINRGDAAMFNQCLSHPEIDVNQMNKAGYTPMLLIIAKGDNWIDEPNDESLYQMLQSLAKTNKAIASEKHTNKISKGFSSALTIAHTRYRDGNSILHRAIVDNNLSFVQWITQQTIFDHLLNQQNNLHETPLHLAIRLGNLQIVQWLWLRPNCDVNTNSADGTNALSIALEQPESNDKRNEIISFILNSEKLDIHKLTAADGHLRLLKACIHNNLFLPALLAKGIDPNQTDKDGNTFLHFAAAAGDINTVQCLLKSKKITSLHFQNHEKLTPLLLLYKKPTIKQGIKNEIVNLLIDETHDLNQLLDKRDGEGNTRACLQFG